MKKRIHSLSGSPPVVAPGICSLVLLAVLMLAGPLSAATYVGGGTGVWLLPEMGFQGFGILGWQNQPAHNDPHITIELNTETLLLSLERLRFGNLVLGASLKGEALIAGVLTAYYQNGKLFNAGGFNASYMEASLHATFIMSASHNIRLILRGRKWWFGRTQDSSSELQLPADSWVFEPRLRYTFWNLRHDAAISDRYRLFPRITGTAAGLTLGADFRSHSDQWGLQSGGVFSDPRNRPGDPILLLRQWSAWGTPLAQGLRLQLGQQFAWGEGEDDLTRMRIGGLNPWVVPVAGLPWAALLSGRFVAGQAGLHVALGGSHELGLLLHGVWLQDPGRTGAEEWGGAGGGGLHLDLRTDSMQLNLLVGIAFPAAWQNEPPHLAAFFTAGSKL